MLDKHLRLALVVKLPGFLLFFGCGILIAVLRIADHVARFQKRNRYFCKVMENVIWYCMFFIIGVIVGCMSIYVFCLRLFQEFLNMSCIKFPNKKNDASTKNQIEEFAATKTQLISIADQVFGQGKWSHAITNQTLDFIEYVAGRYQAGCVSIVKVQLKDGIFHEDVGYGVAEGSTKASTIQKARVGSFIISLKKTLMYFGNEVTSKINSLSSRPSSPASMAPAANKLLQTEASTNFSVLKKDVAEPFAESIPLSQTDALMDIVDLDQIFTKDQKVNSANNVQVKIDVPKIVVPTGNSDKDKKPNNENNMLNEVKVDAPKTTAPTGVNNSNNVDNKSDINSEKKKDNKTEIPKAVVSTVMTEEEMRLERKRKQREMQEEFKRKEEYKKKAGDGGSKLNPRY